MNNVKTKDLIQTAILIALVFIATSIVTVYIPLGAQGGRVHLGNVMVVVSTLLFGTKKGVYASSIGMGLMNALFGLMMWMPFTVIIRGVSTFVMGTIMFKKHNGNNNVINIVAVLIGSLINMVGYYIAEAILFGNWFTPVYAIPGEVIQAGIALFIGLPLATTLKKLVNKNIIKI
jgi:uncharacterized membrane protein